MKVCFAGPLFTTPERTWNAEVTAALRAAGHEVFLPQEREPGKDGTGISRPISVGSTGPMG
jgi:nucleoside 2-deoxyribosyltransferase